MKALDFQRPSDFSQDLSIVIPTPSVVILHFFFWVDILKPKLEETQTSEACLEASDFENDKHEDPKTIGKSPLAVANCVCPLLLICIC